MLPSVCAGQDFVATLISIFKLSDAIDAARSAVAVSTMFATIVTLAPASLSLILGMTKSAKVLKASLPWVRLPSYQLVLSTTLMLPLVVAAMAGVFQLAAE